MNLEKHATKSETVSELEAIKDQEVYELSPEELVEFVNSQEIQFENETNQELRDLNSVNLKPESFEELKKEEKIRSD